MNEVNVNFEEIIAMAKTELSKNKTQNYDLNVLIAGSTGVGKSTLINTVFGKKVALTGKTKAYFLFHDAHQIYMMTLSLSAFFKLLA